MENGKQKRVKTTSMVTRAAIIPRANDPQMNCASAAFYFRFSIFHFLLRSSVLDHGTRLGDIGKQRFDYVVILLFHHPAFQFHREGKSATVECKIRGQ